LRVVALGGVDLLLDDRPIQLRSRKAQALIAYLALNPAPAISRERISGLLWSEFSENRARASLRQILHSTRQVFEAEGFAGLTFDRDALRLDREAVGVDVIDALGELEGGRVPTALLRQERIADTLMAGFDGLDSNLDAWLAVQRRLIGERMESALIGILDEGPAANLAIAAGTALANLDPTNELACRRLMEAYSANGEPAMALKAYRKLWEHLDAEFGQEPTPETKALAVGLKQETSTVAARMAALPQAVERKPQRAVVVAPFAARWVSEELTYLIDGLRLDLIGKLGRFREWVIFDGRHLNAGNSSEFNQRWPHQIWIDAHFIQDGNRLKAALVVREQPEASLIWSDTLLVDLESWFDVERQILARVAATMNLHISTARLIASSGKPDVSLEIYDRWLRGQSIIMNWRPERDQARRIYRDILTKAPNFSPAYSSLAQLDSGEHLALPGVFRDLQREAAALDYARQAVRNDPFDSRAHLALGWSSAMNEMFDQAYAAFETALSLNENDLWTMNSAALGMAYCGNVTAAKALVQRSLGLGLPPSTYHFAYQAVVSFLANDWPNSVRAHDASGNVLPDGLGWRAAALHWLGQKSEAREAARAFLDQVRQKWAGSDEPTDLRIATWFLHAFPIRDRAAWERLRDGIAGAGVPVPADSEISRHP
jgi:DNA-binding SARP family transcriptional activator